MSDDFKVKDIKLAEFGRKEISLAETEMPGLMALRKEYSQKNPQRSKNTRLFTYDNSNSSAYRNIVKLGAECRWSSCNIFSTKIMPLQQLQKQVCQYLLGKVRLKKSIGGA